MDDDAGYYRALGVAPDASDAELRRAYFALAKQLHPDRCAAGTDDAEAAAAARLRDIGEASCPLALRVFISFSHPRFSAAFSFSPPPGEER